MITIHITGWYLVEDLKKYTKQVFSDIIEHEADDYLYLVFIPEQKFAFSDTSLYGKWELILNREIKSRIQTDYLRRWINLEEIRQLVNKIDLVLYGINKTEAKKENLIPLYNLVNENIKTLKTI